MGTRPTTDAERKAFEQEVLEKIIVQADEEAFLALEGDDPQIAWVRLREANSARLNLKQLTESPDPVSAPEGG